MQALAVVTQQALGQLVWDLPAQKTYVPGSVLAFVLRVTNPTAGQRSYRLEAQALVQGELVWYADLLLGLPTDPWFPVPDGKAVDVQGSFTADQTDFTFKVLLVDQVTTSVLASVQTELVGQASPPTQPPTQQPGTDLLATLMPVVSLALVMGLMSSLTRIFPREE